MLTGEAVRALAAARGFDFDGWCAAQMAAVTAAPSEFTLPKLDEAAACWNWALTACRATAAPTPNDVIDWLHLPLPHDGAADPHMPAVIAAIAAGPLLAAKNDLIATKQQMHQHNLAIHGSNYDPNWANDPAQVIRVCALTERAARNIVRLHGFQVDLLSPLAVAIQYKIADGVSWEHWWVEYNDVVVETLPSMLFVMNMTHLRLTQRMTPVQAAQYGVCRIPVANLRPEHHDKVRTGLAQYL